MAKVITITNNKGGCGKTATAVSLSSALSRSGYDVLLVDIDGQSNAGLSLGVQRTPDNVFSALTTGKRVAPFRIRPQSDGNGVLDVLPSSPDATVIESALEGNERSLWLSGVLTMYADDYDVIVIDTPPSLGSLTVGAMYCSDVVIANTAPTPLAVRGMVATLQAINAISTARKKDIVSGILVTMYDGRKNLHRQTVEQLRKSGTPVYSSMIRNCVALEECPIAGTDVFTYAPRSNASIDYRSFADEFIRQQKIKHRKHNGDYQSI